MEKRVILTLDEGSFNQGFRVILRIKEDGAPGEIEIIGRLPPAIELVESFDKWQSVYQQMITADFRIKPKPGQVTSVSCPELGWELAERLNEWLNSEYETWRRLRDRLQQFLDRNDRIRFIIQTQDSKLQQLPWHLWSLFSQNYKNAEVALAPPEYEPPSLPPPSLTNKIRILAVLGDSTDIDVTQDKLEIQKLRKWNADPVFLSLPLKRELTKQLREQQWDILFFAGHSASSKGGITGQIQINEDDSLSIHELKHALTAAIERGLQLAIFNSCDGLGLAHELADLHIPQIIVMRQPVPNKVAQEFLKYFLDAFVHRGKSFYLAVREARERLEEEQDERFPCASWLPVICQNPATEPPTWQGLLDSKTNPSKPIWSQIRAALLLSVVVTASVLGVRQLGGLQTWELQAYDTVMRSRPQEALDPRLLIVTVTEDDFQLPEQKQRIESLSDLALLLLLKKLTQFQARTIGLDIYRDFPIKPDHMGATLQTTDNFFAICKVSDRTKNHPGIKPPKEVPQARLGFSDVVQDPDGILRRHLLAMTAPTSPCTAPYALSAQLAFHYLEAEGISAKYTALGDLQMGNVVFKRLRKHMGGYQQVDDWGYQILLNYRSYRRSPLELAPTVTLTDVLKGAVKPEEVKDRIVLIGVTAQSAHDYIPTPYSAQQGFYQEMPGVIVQAQMVSQLVSAVLDGRPLLTVWPFWGEVLWVWSCSIVGVALAWRLRLGVYLIMAGGGALGVLYVFCLFLLSLGIWAPLVPSALVLVVTGGTVAIYFASQKQQQLISPNLRYD